MNIDDLWLRMERQYEELPPRLREAARYVRERPADVAMHGLRRVAREAGLSSGALMRLVQALGFSGWEDFQAVHRQWLTETNTAVFSDRAGRMIDSAGTPGAEAEIAGRIAEAERANLAAALAPGQLERLSAAAALLHDASQIGVLGLRSCHSVAFGLYYGLSLFHPNVRLIGATGGLMLDEIDTLEKDAALVAISVAPYSRETVEATRYARDAGLRILGISDGLLTPVSRLSDVALAGSNEGPSHLASLTGFVALCQVLTSLVLARSGEAGLAVLRRREALLAARSVYLPPET